MKDRKNRVVRLLPLRKPINYNYFAEPLQETTPEQLNAALEAFMRAPIVMEYREPKLYMPRSLQRHAR